MASNQKFVVSRVIEPGNRNYVFGVFKATHSGRQLVSIVEGTYQDAIALTQSDRTESGHSFKGFKKLKANEA